MGKIYKNIDTKTDKLHNFKKKNLYKKSISKDVLSDKKKLGNTIQSNTYTIPLEHFDSVLESAEKKIEKNLIYDALEDLLNLEHTNFSNIDVHELLAKIYFKINELDLAKKQCQICTELIQEEYYDNISVIKDFPQLLSESGDFEDIKKQFESIQELPLSTDNCNERIKLALNLANHYIAQKKYTEAEIMLSNYRTKYLKYLDIEIM